MSLVLLHQEATANVSQKVQEKAAQASLAPFAVDALLATVPSLVQTVLDLTVQFGGNAIEAAAKAGHSTIRDFVSEKTLEFVDGIIHGLEDVKSGVPPQEGAPAPG